MSKKKKNKNRNDAQNQAQSQAQSQAQDSIAEVAEAEEVIEAVEEAETVASEGMLQPAQEPMKAEQEPEQETEQGMVEEVPNTEISEETNAVSESGEVEPALEEAGEDASAKIGEEAGEKATEKHLAEEASDVLPGDSSLDHAKEESSEESVEHSGEESIEHIGEDIQEDSREDSREASQEASEETKSEKALSPAAKAKMTSPEERNQRKAREAKELQKREERHRRRVRAQVTCWIILILIILLLAGGIVGGLWYLQKSSFRIDQLWGGKTPTNQPSAQTEILPVEPSEEEGITNPDDVISDLIGNEEEITEPEVVPEPEPEPTPEEQLDALIDEKIAAMSIEDRVAGLFLVTPESVTGANAAVKAGPGTQAAIEKYAFGGLVYDGKNIQSQEQFGEMLSTTLSWTKYSTFLAIAEEGGKNAPLANAGLGQKIDSAAEIAAATAAAAEGGDASYTAAYEAGKTLASNLLSVGITLNLAPVGDLASLDGNILGDRSFGADPAAVTENAKAMLQGMKDGQITACLKFFPGLGCTKDDPAKGRAVSERTAQEYLEQDFVVYRNLVETGLVPMVMMSNLVIPALDETSLPATLSESIVTGQLRNTIGFNGVILSGNLSEGAIKNYYSSGEAAILALRAGCDMVYAPEKFEEAYQGVLDAVASGVISENRINDSLKRVYRIKYADLIFGL